MDLIPENLNGAVVINAVNQPGQGSASAEGIDYGVGLHNWLMSTNLRYLIFDLQDEKEINASFIEDMMQLMRRIRIPILFSGVMARPKAVLDSFAYNTKFDVFGTPEQAIEFMRNKYPALMQVNHDGVNFGHPIEMVRSRLGFRSGEDGEGEEESEEADDSSDVDVPDDDSDED